MISTPRFTTQFDRHVPEFYRVFTVLDTKHDGYLDADEINQLLQKLGASPSQGEIDQLMQYIRGSSGETGKEEKAIDFSVFLSWVYRSLQLVRHRRWNTES